MKGKLFFGKLLALILLSMPFYLSAQVTESRKLSGFSAIEASHAFDIVVSKSATESVVIEADEKVMPYVRTEVKNGVLKLYLDKHNIDKIRILKATIGIKELNSVKLSGACKLKSKDIFNASAFEIQLSGASSAGLNVKANKLTVGISGASILTLDIDARDEAKFNVSGSSRLTAQLKTAKTDFGISGASRVDAKGNVDKADFGVSGSSVVKAGNLVCKTVSALCTGGSRLDLNVTDSLEVSSSGSSSVSYKGRPTVKSTVSGASRVRSAD